MKSAHLRYCLFTTTKAYALSEMLRDLWKVIRTRQWLIFCITFVLFTVAAMMLPNTDSRAPLTISMRAVFFATGVATFAFALSLTCYFFAAWRSKIFPQGSVIYRLWIAFETLVGVPVAAVCYVFALASIWVSLFK